MRYDEPYPNYYIINYIVIFYCYIGIGGAIQLGK